MDATTVQFKADFDRIALLDDDFAPVREGQVRRHLLWRYSIVWRKP